MKKLLVVSVLMLLTVPLVTSARSGCCSGHDGVCGCRCCDGSSLSATCAPYYPECNSRPEPKPVPVPVPVPKSESVAAPVQTQPLGLQNETPEPTNSSESDNNRLIGGLVGLIVMAAGAVGGVLYVNNKNK